MIPIEEEGDGDDGDDYDDEDVDDANPADHIMVTYKTPSQWGTSCHFGRYPKKSADHLLI